MRLTRCETGLSPPVKYFTDRSKAVLLLWIFYVFSVLCLLCLCVRLLICALWSPAGKGLTSWLSFVVSNCEFVTFPLVSWVRCGTCLYRFLIFAPLLTLKSKTKIKRQKKTKKKQKTKQKKKQQQQNTHKKENNSVYRMSPKRLLTHVHCIYILSLNFKTRN